MNININDNGFWICFWIIASVTLISFTAIMQSGENVVSPNNKDVIAQRIEAIEDSSIYPADKAALIKQIIIGQINTNTIVNANGNANEIVLEK
jgi:hypothetical protein